MILCALRMFVLLVVRFSRWLSLITNKEAESWLRGDLYLQASPHWPPILLKLLGKLRLKVVINWSSVCTMGYISASYMPYPQSFQGPGNSTCPMHDQKECFGILYSLNARVTVYSLSQETIYYYYYYYQDNLYYYYYHATG